MGSRTYGIHDEPLLGPVRPLPLPRLDNVVDETIPDILSLDDLNLDPEEADVHIEFAGPGKTHRILLGRDDQFDVALDATGHEAVDLALGEGVMVGKSTMELDLGAKLLQEILETLGHRDATDGRDIPALKLFKGQPLTSEDPLEVVRGMGGLHDLGGRVVATETGEEPLVGRPLALGDHDVTGPAKVPGGLAQGAPGQKGPGLRPERSVLVHEDKVVLVIERKILQAVVEHESVGFQLPYREAPPVHTILIHHHPHALEILGQHVGLVPGVNRLQSHSAAVVHDLGQSLAFDRSELPPLLRFVELPALVTAAQDGHPSSPFVKGPGQQFHHRRLARAPHRKITHADHHGAQLDLLLPVLAVGFEPDLYDPSIDMGEPPEQHPGQRRPQAPGPSENHIGPPLFNIFRDLTHKRSLADPANGVKVGICDLSIFPPCDLPAPDYAATMPRPDGREPDQLRPVSFVPDVAPHAAGSVLVSFGNTRVICAATVQEDVPRWMKAQGVPGGWVTAEYSMLPYSTHDRKTRDISRGRLDGRSSEIQRLIGRSLRAVTDLKKLGPRTVWVDCDVLQADGGTRTASITGGCVALAIALNGLIGTGGLTEFPLTQLVAAVSAGVWEGSPILDLNYPEDRDAAVDFNVVMTEDGNFVELQGSGEENIFTAAEMEAMLTLSRTGIEELVRKQSEAILAAGRPSEEALPVLGSSFKTS